MYQPKYFSPCESTKQTSPQPEQSPTIRYVLFDVFGTVVDVRGTLKQGLQRFLSTKGISKAYADNLAEQWLKEYINAMRLASSDAQLENASTLPTVDAINWQSLEKSLEKLQLSDKCTESDKKAMWQIWHALSPWPDSVDGINHLKQFVEVGTLSNGNTALLKDIAKHAGLDWDVILSCENWGCYKPHPRVYELAAATLNVSPSEILLVAAHSYDLRAAKEVGFRTAYINRTPEKTTTKTKEEGQPFDFCAEGIDAFAQQFEQAYSQRLHQTPRL